MSHSTTGSLQYILEAHVDTLALSLRPSSVNCYRCTAGRFLAYLRSDFPQVLHPSQLRRDPHLLGWFASLCDQRPPLSNETRINHLIYLRRLLNELTDNGHRFPSDLIRRQDFPPHVRYLPRPLSVDDDQLLQQQLRRSDNLSANALLLTRATGIRIGECIDLPLDCLRQLGPNQWALHVPVGKLHTERLVPADEEIRRMVERILVLRAQAPLAHLANSQGLLIPRRRGHAGLYHILVKALAAAAGQAGCSGRVTPHRLRHSFASEMIRLGVSLPALMTLLGHEDIRMTLQYVRVTQQDLHREFHTARQNTANPHHIPTLPVSAGLNLSVDGIRHALAAARHLVEMYRRQLGDEKTSRTFRRLDKRLLAVDSQLKRIGQTEK